MAYRAVILILAIAVCVTGPVIAGGSVFSANGVGEQQVGGGIRALGLGGGAFGLRDTMSFNTLNPALLSFAPRTILRLAGHVGYWNTTAKGQTDSDTEVMWKDAQLLFPASNKWRLGLGMQPSEHQDIETIAKRVARFDSELERYEERVTWSGSAVDLRLDNAYRVSDNLAFGLGAIYTVLHSENTNTVDFDSSTFRDVQYHQLQTFRSWSLSFGAFVSPLPNLGFGAYYRPRLFKGYTTSEFSKSSSDSVIKHNDRAESPGEFAVGISYKLSPSYVSVLDARVGQWSAGDYGIVDSRVGDAAPQNPLFLSAGVERLGRRGALYSGLDLWGYRAGLFYRRHYWSYTNGATVDDVGLTLGLSLPVAQSTGLFHAAAEFGQRGQDENKLGAKETFARISLQIEIGESWFQRTKPRVPD